MTKKLTAICIGLAFTIGQAYSQHSHRSCGTMEVLQQQLQNDPQLKLNMEAIEQQTAAYIANHASAKSAAVVTIPVVFHIVWNTNAENISDARINEQLNVLNNDFARTNADAGNTPSAFQNIAAPTNVRFCLAKRTPAGTATTGIVRYQTTASSFSSNNGVKFASSGGADIWDRNQYLNVWVCNLGGGLLGYAQFPGGTANTDGVVVLYSSVGGPNAPGTANPYHLGRTLTHEVGHWLNLRHIWGDASCGNDLVNDTPTQQTSNFACPSFPHVTCSNGPNGDMFMNYMDYVDDGCMNAFSAGQSTRMDACLSSTRASLATSPGCTPLSNCNGDPYEPNNTNATAKVINKNTDIYAMIGSTTDADWYKYTTVAPATNSKITLTQLPANYNMKLFNNANVQLGVSTKGGLQNEQIIYNAAAAATYKIRVWGSNGAFSTTQCYVLRASVSSTPYVREDGGIAYYDNANEMLVYPNPAQYDVALAFESEEATNATITVYDAIGKVAMATNAVVTEGANLVNLNIENFNPGLYIVELRYSANVYRVKVTKN